VYSLKLGASVLDDIMSQRVTEGFTISEEAAGGDVDITHQSIMMGEPKFDFTTKQLASLLGAMSNSGGLARLSQDMSTLSGGAVLYWQKRLAGGVFTTGSAHLTTTCAKGIMNVTSITAERNRDVDVAVEGVGLSADGVTHPFVEASAAALATKGAADERFVLGDVIVEEVLLDNLTRVVVRPNIELEILRTNSDGYPTLIAIKSRKPIIELTGFDIGAGLNGLAVTQAETTITFRKRAKGGMYVADETAEHVSLTVAGMITRSEKSASGLESGEATYELRVANDGTNALMTWNLATAL